MLHFFLSQSEKQPVDFVVQAAVFFLLIFFFSIVFFYFRVEISLINKIKKIYEDFSTTTGKNIFTNNESEVEMLTESLKKFASDRKLEIQLLKEQENYRKEFIGNLSHELKTPLFTIQGYVLTLLDGAVNDKSIAQKYLKRTAKGVDRLNYIIQDLDIITKFESGMENIQIKKFNILETLENVFDLLEIQAQKNNVNLLLEQNFETPIFVSADEKRIQQVLTNLIFNSIKYGVEDGTTEISIEELSDQKLLVRITDNGEGIAKEHLPRLFERFYRVDKNRSREKGGSGLGLAIVKHIIEAHQEKIFVESTPGIGSEFSFTLTKA
ncbi:MAG: sensor histidine kinase [Flavobacteriaceae bacterium]|nr:sensor histidine kinase [Flavobacteriaceae bacterium]